MASGRAVIEINPEETPKVLPGGERLEIKGTAKQRSSLAWSTPLTSRTVQDQEAARELRRA